jgi:hypothetical protein
LLATFGITLALASGAMAQVKTAPTLPDKPILLDSAAKAELSAKFAELLANLPDGLADKLAAARDAARAAKADLDAMRAQGKTPEEIKALIEKHRAEALANLEKALEVLNTLPEDAKERVNKAKENIAKRIEERKAENP